MNALLKSIRSIFVEDVPTQATENLCLLRIGPDPDHLIPVDDPQGLGAYQLAVNKLIREQSPELIFCVSDDPKDLSVVRKALQYLSRLGQEIGVAPQLPDEEVAAIFGVSVQQYRSAVADPNGAADLFQWVSVPFADVPDDAWG